MGLPILGCMGKKYVTIETSREGYAPSQLHDHLTVGELISILRDFNEDMPVIFSNDDGYTYGDIHPYDINEYEDNER